MQYRFRGLGWRDALAIARWRYEGRYAFYNLSLPALASMVATQYLLSPLGIILYTAVLDERGALVGMFSFIHQGKLVEIGLALRPDLTGKGAGEAFVNAGLDFARHRFQPSVFRLIVATFNHRAIRVYERAGFTAVRTFTRRDIGQSYEALEMRRDA